MKYMVALCVPSSEVVSMCVLSPTGIQLNISGKGKCQFTLNEKSSFYSGKEVFLNEHIQLADRGSVIKIHWLETNSNSIIFW